MDQAPLTSSQKQDLARKLEKLVSDGMEGLAGTRDGEHEKDGAAAWGPGNTPSMDGVPAPALAVTAAAGTLLAQGPGAIAGAVLGAAAGAVAGALQPLLLLLVAVPSLLAIVASALVPLFSVSAAAYTYTSGYDAVCYLSAKYESGGDPDCITIDSANGTTAFGEFQFCTTGNIDGFVSECCGADAVFYSAFLPYLGMRTGLHNNGGFISAWHSVCASGSARFEQAQMEFAVATYLDPVASAMTAYYGYDFTSASDALRGCILSFSVRDGASLANMKRYFSGIDYSSATEEEIITYAYDKMIARRSGRRWPLEKADCLALYKGELDIYEASGNAAGGIDWSWKKPAADSEYVSLGLAPEALSDTRFAAILTEAEKYLGVPYVWGACSPSGFDCSGFVSYVLNHSGWSVGRRTANGLLSLCTRITSAGAEPGDLIFFQGTYKTSGASHVGIYVGGGMMIHCSSGAGKVTYSSVNTAYYRQHFLCYGRLS